MVLVAVSIMFIHLTIYNILQLPPVMQRIQEYQVIAALQAVMLML